MEISKGYALSVLFHIFIPLLKLEQRNILISENGDPLLCDFGLSSFVEPEPEELLLSKSTADGGSFYWMAPELHEAMSPGSRVSCASDIWAFGMVIIEVRGYCRPIIRSPYIANEFLKLLTGNYPFKDELQQKAILWRIINRILPLRPKSYECTDELWDLIQGCWEEQEDFRPSASYALKAMKYIAKPCSL